MRNRGFIGLLALLIAALALIAAGCGGEEEAAPEEAAAPAAVEALPSSSCQPIEFKGEGEPDVLIASDFPMQGASRTQTVQIVQAIRFVLDQRGWKAGDKNVGFQVCDDSTAQAGKWDSGKCNQNAQAYAQNESVVGVIGTFNSGCAAIVIPVLNQAPGGALGMVSPANTFVCLTEGGGTCEATEPDKYYPTGQRNYIRMVAHDAYQGAAMAQFAKDLKLKNIYVLNDKEAYGLGVAQNFRSAAQSLGLKIAGFAAWDPRASSYEALMRKIGGTGADAIFLGGLIDENGGQLIKDKVAVLGPNDGKVKLLAPDGFTTQSTLEPEQGGAKEAVGMYASVAGVPPEQLTGAGKEFVATFKQEALAGEPIDPYAAYAAQAAEVMLDAIANSDGTRAGVIEQLLQTKVQDGILGSFDINENGDPTVGPVTVYLAKKEFKTFKVITPSQELVAAAKGE